MKRIAFGLLTLALMLVACNKNDIDLSSVDNNVETNEGIPFTATISAGDNVVTRALTESGNTLVATWKVGEKVRLIHHNVKDEMTVSEVNDGVATITGTISDNPRTGSPKTGDDVIIIYPSTAADALHGETASIVSSYYETQNGTLTGSGSIAEKYDVRRGSGTLKVSNGTASLNGNVSLANQFAIFKLTVRQYDGTTAINTKPLTITADGHTYTITPSTATDVLYVALPPVYGKVVFDAMDGSGKTYTCGKSSVIFYAGKFYQSTLKMRQYVDMGDGLKLADCNLGASNPWDDGDYYAWGETTTKTNYDWSNYVWGGSSDFTKYTGSDYATLQAEDDVARQQWGGTWRIPTEDERQALKNTDKFTWTWTTDYHGKKGMLVTSKLTGNQIFLPAAGCYEGSSLNVNGSYGYYWTSSLANSTQCAWHLCVSSAGAGGGTVYRCNGYSVRPVAE